MSPRSLVIALILITTACGQDHSGTAFPVITGTGQAIDGDSLLVNGIEIRLWGTDAPEYKQRCFKNGKSWHCGQDAKTALAKKIKDKPLSCQQKDIDRYDRIVAECFIQEENLNGWLVRNGWALAYRRFSKKFINEEEQAKAEKRGIWDSEFTLPWLWR